MGSFGAKDNLFDPSFFSYVSSRQRQKMQDERQEIIELDSFIEREREREKALQNLSPTLEYALIQIAA